MCTENFKPPESFKCKNQNIFLNLSKVCNGIIDCKFGDDESFCFNYSNVFCPFGCNCRLKLFIECNFGGKHQKEIHFNFLLKKLTILNNKNMLTLTFLHKFYITQLRIENSRMLKIISLKTPNLIFLILRYNNIRKLQSSDISAMRNLQHLDLTGNKISIIPNEFFYNCQKLLFIDLSKNHLYRINDLLFSKLKNLKELIIKRATIENLDEDSFKNLEKLEKLFLTDTELPRYLPLNLLSNLSSLKVLNSKYHYLCCMTEKYELNMEDCKPKSSMIKACLDLIDNVYLRIVIWIIVILGLIGNIIALIIQQQNLKPSSIFFMSLHISDIFLILYLTIIGIADINFKGNYMENDANWRFSSLCSFAGALANIAIMNSNFSLILITMDRYLAICHNLIQKKYFYNVKQFLFASLIFLLISCLIGILPIFQFKVTF